MENHRHAKTHKKATQIHPMSNNSFIKSYKKVVDILIRLRYYKHEHRSLRTSQGRTVYQTVCSFLFHRYSIISSLSCQALSELLSVKTPCFTIESNSFDNFYKKVDKNYRIDVDILESGAQYFYHAPLF